MAAKDIDEQRETERAEWAARGAAWDRWADQQARLADRLNQPLIAGAGIAPGQHVLDLASGAGEPAISIAKAVGDSGSVTATDLVPEMLAGARRRAAGIGNMRFEIADMTALPFPDARFDRVTCRFGLMFPPEPVRALREALRVLKRGGRAAFMVWGPLADNTNFVVIDRVASRLLGRSFEERPISPLRLAETGIVERLMREAGFAAAEETELRFSPKVDAGLPFWRAAVDMMLGHIVDSLGTEKREAIDQAVKQEFAAYLRDGSYHLEMHARLAIGQKA